jgi:hypothetical protein
LSQATIDIKIDISVPSNILQNFTDACTLGAPAEFLNDLKKDVTSKLSPSR